MQIRKKILIILLVISLSVSGCVESRAPQIKITKIDVLDSGALTITTESDRDICYAIVKVSGLPSFEGLYIKHGVDTNNVRFTDFMYDYQVNSAGIIPDRGILQDVSIQASSLHSDNTDCYHADTGRSPEFLMSRQINITDFGSLYSKKTPSMKN